MSTPRKSLTASKASPSTAITHATSVSGDSTLPWIAVDYELAAKPLAITAPRTVGTKRRGAPTHVRLDDPNQFARIMADGFELMVTENLVADSTPKSTIKAFRIFKDTGPWPRLDIDIAATVAKRGLKVQAIEDWLNVAKVPKKGFYDGLHVSPSTLSRKGKETRLDAAVTERLVRHSELMVRAAQVFGEGAAEWMTKAHPLLGGEKPIDAAANEYGGAKVREILNAIEHGGVV
jgi:putative toxin-antitoxin system antitoxin component (TIGR02293 family)